MRADWSDIKPVASDWFQSSVQYEGEGRASFMDTEWLLCGPTVVSFDERGKAMAQMTGPTVVSNGQTLSIDVLRLLLSGPPCLGLSVVGEAGTFETDGKVSYNWEDKNIIHGPGDTSSITVTFRWLRSSFTAAGCAEHRHWVLPLLNFLFSPNQRAAQLDRHPLRIYPTPVVAAEPDEDYAFLQACAEQKNRLVIFEYLGELGFIERLADYEKRSAALESGQERRVITAVMVGRVGGASDTWNEVKDWFPFDLLGLLGMASGADVDAPWLEFRSDSGALVRRWHVPLRMPDYSKGHVAIDERIHTGVGRLVTCALASKEFGDMHLRVAIRHLIDGLGYEQPIEERIGHFCRGIDGLCKAYDLTGVNLLKGVGEKYRSKVRKTIAEAAKAIKALAAQAAGSGDTDDSAVLETIANRTISNPAYVDYNFGNAAIRLMQHFGLADAEVMARFLGAEGSSTAEGLRKWAKWLSDCRGIAMHGGHFDVAGGRHDAKLLWKTAQHLLDILLRMVFRIVGYDGTYRPAVAARFDEAKSVDWVTPETDPHMLGYTDDSRGTDGGRGPLSMD